jgi:hypothetical protein
MPIVPSYAVDVVLQHATDDVTGQVTGG